MIRKIPGIIISIVIFSAAVSSCTILRPSSKYNFNDGLYNTSQFGKHKVYVLKVDDDTIAVFPVIQYKDSTSIITSKRVNYTNIQKKLRDNKISRTFYKPSFDVDVMTIPIKYRAATDGFPNQLNNNFNGAVYGGYRIDAYHLNYQRTPLNNYKQNVKHTGYSAGLYAGIGNTLIQGAEIKMPNFPIEYEGVLLLTGVAANVAYGNLTFGISCGPDFLLDKYHSQWLYEGKFNVGFTLGLNLND